MATDTFGIYKAHEDWSPARHAFTITPSNSEDLPYLTRSIYVGGAGDITAIMAGGEEVTFKAIPVGTILPIRVSRVKVTGTDATFMIGLY